MQATVNADNTFCLTCSIDEYTDLIAAAYDIEARQPRCRLVRRAMGSLIDANERLACEPASAGVAPASTSPGVALAKTGRRCEHPGECPPPLVITGQGSYRRAWPQIIGRTHTAELIGGPAASIAAELVPQT